MRFRSNGIPCRHQYNSISNDAHGNLVQVLKLEVYGDVKGLHDYMKRPLVISLEITQENFGEKGESNEK